MSSDRFHAQRGALAVLLAGGWMLGLAAQVAVRLWTGFMDVTPPQMLLGLLLCAGSGALVRLGDRTRGPRRGALAGVAMVASVILGYAVLTALLWKPAWSGGEGETPQTLLLEAPFWIGVPLVVAAACGALGWYAADRLAGRPGSTIVSR